MRCAKCESIKAKHTVIEEDRQAGAPMAAVHRFWDEDNREHVHDGRYQIIFYRCSNSHSFSKPDPLASCDVPGCRWPGKLQDEINAKHAAAAAKQ